MDKQPIISKEYNISLEMFRNAFVDFQKKFSYPKNIIMSLAFGFIGISYIFPLIKNPENSTCILIITICAFLIAGIWINTFMIRKNLMNSIEGIQGDRYIAELYENSITISTLDISDADVSDDNDSENTEDDFFAETPSEPLGMVKTVIDFINDDVKILEKNDYFIIYLVKRMFYVVPKSVFNDEEIKMLTESFKKAKFIEERS